MRPFFIPTVIPPPLAGTFTEPFLTGSYRVPDDPNIYVLHDDDSPIIWECLNNDGYTDEEAERLRSRWGARIGEIVCGQTKTEIFPDYIASLKHCLSQQEFTEWYLWKYPNRSNPITAPELINRNFEVEQISLF